MAYNDNFDFDFLGEERKIDKKGYLQYIIERSSYKCKLEGDTLIFADNRLDCLLQPNRDLSCAVRSAEFIKRIDLSSCAINPLKINDFPFIEEVVLADEAKFLPSIDKCPRLVRMKCKTASQTPFMYPNVDYCDNSTIRFSEELVSIPDNLRGYKELDFSKCVRLKFRERDLQYCDADTIILPFSIEELPYFALRNCPKLRNVLGGNIKSIRRGALAFQCPLNYCPSLQRIQFSRDLSEDEIRRQVSQIQLGPEKRGRHGIVVCSDNEYSYIWCFNVRLFYYTKNIDIVGTFVAFEHPIRREIFVKDGLCQIIQGDEWFVENIQDNTKHILWDPYPGFSERRTEDGLHPYWVDVQSDAVAIYRQLEERLQKPLTKVIEEINQTVDSLDIEAIIDAFATTYSHDIHDKVGGDVREEFLVRRSSFYNDGYLETLMPTYRNYSVETGYGYSLNNFSNEEIEASKITDAEYRERARKSYNIKEHKRFLIDEYIRKMVDDAKFVERCLWIESAKRMLKETANLKGVEKVLYLNKHIRM